MSDESEHGNKGVIPYFFYDIISFIIPGAFLLIGGFSIWLGEDWSSALYHWLNTPNREESSLAAISVIFGIVFLLFLGIAASVGYLLSATSHLMIEQIYQRWKPYTLSGLSTFMGEDKCNEKLSEAFRARFGMELKDDCNMEKASALCAYYIWSRSMTLGAMTSRFDAEKIMSQSLILVSILLLIEDGFFRSNSSPLIVGLAISLIASWFAFIYHRKKRVYGRFQIFLVLAANDDGQANNSD